MCLLLWSKGLPSLCDRVFGEDARAERDVLGDLLAVQDLKRQLDRLLPAGGILERGRKNAFLHVSLSLVGQRVDPDELDLLLAPLAFRARRCVGAMRARVVVTVHRVDM